MYNSVVPVGFRAKVPGKTGLLVLYTRKTNGMIKRRKYWIRRNTMVPWHKLSTGKQDMIIIVWAIGLAVVVVGVLAVVL